MLLSAAVVSGGLDCKLLHWDVSDKNLISSRTLGKPCAVALHLLPSKALATQLVSNLCFSNSSPCIVQRSQCKPAGYLQELEGLCKTASTRLNTCLCLHPVHDSLLMSS